MSIKSDPPLLSVVLSLAYLHFSLLLIPNVRATRTFQASVLVLSDASMWKSFQARSVLCFAWFVYKCALKWKQLKVFSVGNRVLCY